MTEILVSAGDASGDLHAAAFVRALRARRPALRFFGLGGVALEAAGVELVVHQRELAVGGLVEVLGSLRRIVGAWRRLGAALRERRPALAVLVDSPDFQIPFARRVRRAGVPVLYYVSPQVWAWRRGRVRKIARRVDRLAAIFPFEPEFYAGRGLRVEFVGHPLVEPLRALAARTSQSDARRALGLDPAAPLVLLLPGSRRNELRHHLPLMAEVAREVHARRPEVRFAMAIAPTLARADVEALLRASALPPAVRVDLVEGRAHEAILASDVALAKPGTVTMEIALLDRPLVVVGRANPLSVAIGRRLISVPSLTMPNLVAGAPVVPEFLQQEAVPARVGEAVTTLLGGPARELALAKLARVRERLGAGGAAERTARIAEEMLDAAARA
jgi:lipid-A-disaccharide synthase